MRQDDGWLKSISRISDTVAQINEGLLKRVSFGKIDDDNGEPQAEIIWEKTRKWQKKQLKLNDGHSFVTLESSGVYAPRLAYKQNKDQRKITLTCPDQISIELSQQTLEKVATPRGLGVAVSFGALAGLVGWVLAFCLSRLDLFSRGQEAEQPLPQISTKTMTQDEKVE